MSEINLSEYWKHGIKLFSSESKASQRNIEISVDRFRRMEKTIIRAHTANFASTVVMLKRAVVQSLN